jgi:hypothetical protein
MKRIEVHPDKSITVNLEFGNEPVEDGQAVLISDMAS